jgi:tetratricopeptide (TPR) repeat protein
MTRHAALGIALAALLVVTRTSSQSGAAGTALQRAESGGADFVYPLPGTAFPPELPPPEFIWRCDAEAAPDRRTIHVRCPNLAGPMVFERDRPRWRPPPQAWRRIKALSTGAEATVTVLAAAAAREKRGHSDFLWPRSAAHGAARRPENQNVPHHLERLPHHLAREFLDGKRPFRFDRMNSWHAWSPNGRWLVFATKLRGPYTQLCLTHVDEAGNDSPPVLLEHAMLPERACNIPEFLNLRPAAELAIRVDFLDSHNYRRQGQVLLGSGDAAGAVPLFEKALALDGGDHDARLRLAAALAELGRADRARAELDDLLDRLGRGHPPDAERLYQAHCHAAALCRTTGRLADAADHYRRAVSAKPQDVDARILLALVHASQAEFGEAHRVLAEAADLKPASALVRMWLGQVLADQGRHGEALEQFRRALRSAPDERQDWLLVARRAARYARPRAGHRGVRPNVPAGIRALGRGPHRPGRGLPQRRPHRGRSQGTGRGPRRRATRPGSGLTRNRRRRR